MIICPDCGVMIPVGPLSAKCNACGFDSAQVTLDELTEALKKGTKEREAAERTLKRNPRR